MKLFLASEMKHPKSITKLRKFVGGSFKNLKIAYIPTAANGEEPFGSWKKNSTTWKLVNALGAKVTAVQLEDYKNSTVIEMLKNKDVLWFAGGQTGYLMYWIRRCEVDISLPKLLEKSIYVGSSAGSMVTSIRLSTTQWYIGEGEPGAGIIPGLGLVDFEIYPHYEDPLLPQIKKHWRKGELYLLKNGEVITVVDSKVKVLGKKRVLNLNP